MLIAENQLVQQNQGLGAGPALYQLLKHLVDNGVDAKTHYSIAIHKQAGYPWGKQARIVGSVENAERNAVTCVSLPMFPELTEQEVDYVIAKTLEWDKDQA